MSQDPAEAYVRAAADLAGLALDEDQLATVTANTRILRALAAEFVDLPLADDLDPAPVLRL